MNLPEAVTVKDSNEWAHLYADDLSTILDNFYPGEVGFALPGERHHLWHSFRRVILRDKWGWVSCEELVRV